ncbi:MAG: beta-sandwich lipoprotein [Candidatus Hodarchaeales archaeon]
MKKFVLFVIVVSILLVGCEAEADVASRNLSLEADQFQVTRRIVFYNGITDDYILVIEGFCSLGNHDLAGELTVTCKTGEAEYKKHFLGLSDNVTYFAEQLEPVNVSGYHYKVYFRPETILPDIELDIESTPSP